MAPEVGVTAAILALVLGLSPAPVQGEEAADLPPGEELMQAEPGEAPPGRTDRIGEEEEDAQPDEVELEPGPGSEGAEPEGDPR